VALWVSGTLSPELRAGVSAMTSKSVFISSLGFVGVFDGRHSVRIPIVQRLRNAKAMRSTPVVRP